MSSYYTGACGRDVPGVVVNNISLFLQKSNGVLEFMKFFIASKAPAISLIPTSDSMQLLRQEWILLYSCFQQNYEMAS